MTQMDLFDKPFHSITVWRTTDAGNTMRSLVLRYDALDLMQSEIQRQLDHQLQYPQSRRIAYIYACACEGEGRHYKVVTLDTYYPEIESVPNPEREF